MGTVGVQQQQQQQQQPEESTSQSQSEAKHPPPPAHITFNGPVFFGYSAEQTASLMQQLGNLANFNKPPS
jgi:hypothetical protein